MGKSWDDLTSAASASESDWDKLATPEGKPKTGRTAGEFLKDVGADILGGTLGVAKVGALVGDAVSHRQGFNNPAVRFLNEFGDSVSAQKSDVLREKEQANEQAIETAGKAARETYGDGALGTAARVASEFGTGAKGILTDPALLTGFAAQQIPMLGGMGVGSAVANKTVGAAAKALPKLAATKAGQVAVGGAGTAGAVGAGMALQGTEVADSAYNELMKLPDAAWRNHPAFESLAAKIGAEQAKVAIANREAAEAGGKGALATLLTTLIPGGASVERLIAGKGVGSLKAIPGAVFGEARQEGLEEGFGKLYGNQAVGAVDPTKDVWQGVGGNAGQGAVGGGMLGGAMTGGRLALDSVDEPAKRMAEALAQRGDAGSGNAPVTADEVLGHSSFANSEQPPAPAKQSEAEKALLAPKPITALDRVTEIDTELTNIAPKLTNDPAEVDKAEQLQAERDGITATWPKAALGAPASFSTETGARLDGQYALIEADELTTSHDENLKPTPTYPPEMQPRERDRTASEMQIQAIVGRLDPARLGESADAATGAPIVGADGLVESGNARTIALKRVYQANGQKAADYKQFIKDQAGRLGITQESIDAMRKPVLVRVRTTPVNRAEFARQANASTVAQMSPSEQAKADAARIDALDDLNPDESGDFATSRSFIRRFVARLPGTEQAGMIDADGELSQSGYTRVRNAVLAKAYGDSPVLMRMVESLDDDQRNVSKALMKVAPTVAKMRQSIGEGALFDADLTPDLLAAVDALGTLRGKGRTVATELAQSDVFGGKYSDETREILAFLADNIRRPNQIAALIQQFAEVLGAAGNPNQGSLLGEATAPAKRDILAAARRELNDNDAAGNNGETGQGHRDAGAEARRQPEAAPGAAASDSRNEAARGRESAGQSEWVAFPAESGTLGIPRAEMPQVKGEHRGALIQFLEARGITYERVSVPPSEIKPTQAEFSTKKAAKWAEVREDVDRSVLMSSDGHILDGHHQYVAALAAGEPVTAIRFDAPIRELLAAVFQFPSVKQSEGSNVVELRAQARQEFKDAMADLAQIMTKHTRAAMMPEDTPGLMPTLVKLFEAGIKEVGYSLKDLVAYVKARLKDDSRFKTSWNKIDRSTLNKAAQQAIENAATQRVDDLFSQAEERNGQQDMFAQAPAVQAKNSPTVAMIDGRPYDMKRDNFKPPLTPEFLTPELLKRADEFIAKYYNGKPEFIMSPEDRAAGEALLAPSLARAAEAKAAYDQKIIDIARRTPAIGQMLAPLKGSKRAVEKMKQDQEEKGAAAMDPADVKDLLRSTIVVNAYSDAQAVLDEIEKEFSVARVKNRAETDTRQAKSSGRSGTGGYSDILVNVVMPNGTVAEIQINVSEMLAIKEHQGHKLFEAARDLPSGDRLKAEIYGAMTEIYDAAFRSANSRQPLAQFKNTASEIGAQPLAGNLTRGSSESPESSSLNTLPSGNSTNSSPPNEAQNRLPSGNLSGTGIISTTSNDSIAKPNGGGYTNGINSSIGDANAQHGNTGTEGDAGQGAGTASAADGKRPVTGIRDGAGRGDQQPDRHTDGGARQQAGGERGEDTAGEGGNSQHRRQDGDGNRSARNAAIPAGRDIPAKSGRNYQFGDGDLTYAGSWHTKARQNVEAVELLKKLETEGRQAARDEQATLARFIGWGSSEMANSIFGEKLDKQLEALSNYDEAIERLGDSAFLTNASHYNYSAAFKVLQAKNPALNWYTAGNITKAMLDAAKPDVSARKWGELRDRLKKSMTQEQWDSASRSTQYAHYTSKPVVKSLLAAVSKMGFKGGTILEPGAGIGVFPGLMPAEMAVNSVYTGIEYDPITGGILKQLFPDERILVESFIDSKLPENFYDVAFGNPPFSGDVKVLADPKYVKQAFALHDYFFAKSLDSVKPGGLLVFVTSRYTMDKKGDKARAFMAERADLVGAIRLPQTAFQKNAGTEVVTDVLFMRKKVPAQEFGQAQAWAGLGEVQTEKGTALVNEYFAAHPEMVLGTHSRKGSMYGKDEYTVLPKEGDIEAQFAAAVENLPADVFVAGRGSAAEAAKVREMDFDPKAKKEGSFYVTGAGILMQREGGIGVRAEEKHQKNAAILKDYISLRDAVKQSQLDQLSDGDWESSLKALQKAYAGFVQKNGRLFQHTTYMQKVKVEELDDEGAPTGQKIDDEEQRRRFPAIAALRHDPEYTLALALENFNEDTGEITDSKWLTERTLGKPVAAEVRTPADALLATLNDTGVVDMVAVADRIGLSEQETIDALGTLVYEDPAQGWVMADEYLSGNVKSKLAKAEEAAKSDKAFSRNVEALKSVQPAPRSPEQITPQIGMNWIPGAVYEQFLEDVAGVKAKIEYVKRTREWVLTTISGESSPRATSDWGVGDKAHAGWLMEKSLSGAPISLNKSVSDGKGGHKQTFDPDRTEAANQKRMELRAKFREWLFQDAKRTTDLVQLYNDKFNTTVQRKFDGTHLTLPGTSKLFKIFDHVKRGAWRVIQTGNTYLAHAVGSGKTFEMVISAMEQKRLGLIKKPMIIVPGHMLQQFASEWQQLYPTARLMVADETDFHTDNRRRFVSRVAMSDLDGVIMTHSSFGLLDLDPVFKQKMIEQELDVMRASYEEAGGDLDDIGNKKVRKDPKIKRIEAQIEKLEQRLAKAMSSEGKDKNVRFDEMGVDMLYVDEAHLFRKLSFATSRQTKGIDPAGSQMAWDLYMKTRWLAEKNPTRNLVMASGTAITNTTAELYTVQRFMAPQVLEENGLSGFDDWASQFGEESTSIESTASGKYEPVTRFQNFVNVGEMTQMFRDFADVLNEDHLAALLGDERPKVFGGGRKPVITPKTESYKDFLAEELAPRIQASRNWKPSKDELYNPDPIIAINIDARLAAIDMRFMDPSLPNDPDSKLNHLIDGVIRVYKETESNEYRGKSTKDKDGNKVLAPFEEIKGSTQMVFFESGFGKMVAQRRGFNARAWMEKRLRDAGIPPSQLAFMEDYKKSTAKLKLFKEVNSGKVRVLVGSSAAMGTGVNAQQRLIALHHLDAPYVPAILEQREGRIVRQGNKNSQVQIYAYSMFGSFDENQWSMLARKKFFIEQAMSGDPNIRSIEDVGEVNQLEMAAGLVAENPFVMQHAGAKAEVEKLTRLYRSHEEQRGRMREDYDNAGRTIAYNEQWLPKAEKAAERVKDLSGDKFVAKAGGKDFAVRKEWGAALMSRFKDLADKLTEKETKVGEISGFDVTFSGSVSGGEYRATLRLMTPEPLWMAADSLADPVGLALRSVNGLVDLSRKPGEMRKIISEATSKREALESRLDASFPLAEQLANKIKETADLEAQMMAYGSEKTGLDREQEIEDAWQERTGAITPMFSRLNQVREDTGRRIHTEDLNAVANAFRAAFPGLPVHALESERQAPKELLKWIGEQNARGEWSGAIHRGEIYLLRSGLMDAAHAMETAIHEAAHAGLERMFGQQLDGAMLAIYQTNPSVRAKADALMQRYRYSAVRATNEVLADMGPKAKRVIAWSKLVARVRDILRGIKIGGKPLVKQWSDNDINALVLRALAAAKRPAGGVAQGTWTALSRSAMKSLSANMQRGFDSLAKAITERTSVHRAMFRNGLGWVDFVWGDQGEVKASGRTKGARGLSHIVEARMRKDGLSESQAIAVLREMVRAIAAGEEFDRKAFADVVRVGVRHDGFIAWLAKRPGGNAWVVTGYEENPDGKAAGRATASPTSAAASLTRDDDGAGSIGSVGVLDADGNTSLSRVGQAEVTPTLEQQADAIISTKAATAAPLDALVRASAQALKIDKLTTAAYDKAGALLDRLVPEAVKAGIVSDYGVPEAVIDRRVVSEARQKKQTRAAGALIDKLSTLTRAESRVAYAWMNNDDPQAAEYFEQQLPEESAKVLAEVKKLIDDLSKEAMRLGQLSPEAFERNRFAYLHRSYVKHTAELTKGETKGRARAISILGDQYKGRGMVDGVPMSKVMNTAPEWWKRKLQNGKADAMLKGEKFVRLERRAAIEGAAVLPLEERWWPAMGSPKAKPRLLETIYWPAGETIPARYAAWEQAGTWEVRDTKGDKLIVWRDFTAQERQQLGEIDEARYAIAKTLHNMIHDVETGHYLEWLAQNYAKKEGEEIDGAVVEAREWGGLTPGVLKPGEWVLVPDTKIPGTKVLKYGALAGRYLPGPIWNDVRQMTGRFQPLGESYAAILRAWKMSKTSLSPGVHMNNVMSNFVMADWHDVTAGHVLKALKLMASKDASAAEVLARFGESGGTIGTWAVKELQQEQLRPLLEALEAELGMAGEVAGQVGVMSALQLAMRGKLGQAFDAARLSKSGQMTGKAAQAMLDTYEAEDQVFRLAAWLKAKEEGASDIAAGKVARKSFLDYRINAPWVQMMRSTALPFVAFTYRAVPMMLETAAKKPWKLAKLGLVAGAINALGYMLSGGDEDDERKLLPEEKSGRIWGITPKLIRMPWNDEHGSPVFLDVRRWVPVGDVFDIGQTHAAVPILPSMQPGGPLMIMAELALNKQGFTGKSITLDTDTATEQATKLADYLWKAAAPNIPVLPGTYSWTAISNSATGKTDTFGREQSLPQAVVSSMGIKVGSYPKDVLRMNAQRAAQAELMEIDRNITMLKREHQKHGMSDEEFREKAGMQAEKKRKVAEELRRRFSGR